MKRGSTGIICILLLVVCVVATAAATTNTTDTSVSYTVLPYVALSIGPADCAARDQQMLVFPSLTDEDWQRGYVEQSESVDLRVVANTSWTLTAELLAPVRWIGTGAGPGQAPILSWAILPGDAYTDLTCDAVRNPQFVSSGDRGVHQLSLRYRVDLRLFAANAMEIETVEAVVLYTVVAD
ncbi:hypothetical protein JW848_00710 [Candidatus Bipolaricaulota bacterium]|nr:hypothetical protein [Candidatus Bipolaricaulota bacterium]